MKKIIKSILVIASLLLQFVATAQTATNGIIEKKFEVTPFHYLVIKGELNIILLQGDTESLKVKASAEGQNSIVVKQKDEKLTIRKKALNFNEEKVFVYVTVNRLDAIFLSQDAYVNCPEQIKTDKLVIVAKDNSKIDLKTNAATVKTVFESKTNINIKGNYVCHPAEDFHGGIESICVPLVSDSTETHDAANEKLTNPKLKTYVKRK